MEPDVFTHDKEYHDIVNNKETLKKYTEKFLNNIIDELTLGIIFDTHRKAKMRGLELDVAGTLTLEENLPPNVDIFGQNVKKMQECECPNCDRVVSAARFAPHLGNCMGMGRIRPRYASRRTASNNDNNSSYSELPSDNEDDAHWNSGDKRRKKKQRNGTKKGKGTPKKSNRETETVESLNVDIEGDEDGDINLRDFLQDSSNHSSPAESVTYSNNNSFKKKEKGKNKKSNKRDRISPSTSLAD